MHLAGDRADVLGALGDVDAESFSTASVKPTLLSIADT